VSYRAVSVSLDLLVDLGAARDAFSLNVLLNDRITFLIDLLVVESFTDAKAIAALEELIQETLDRPNGPVADSLLEEDGFRTLGPSCAPGLRGRGRSATPTANTACSMRLS
jgi:hypothetical protein